MPLLRNPKHELFAQERAKGLSASDAYERAGFTRHDGNACRLNKNEAVRTRVEELLGEAAERCGVTVDRIVQELAKIGFANSRDFFEWDQDGVRIKASAELTPDQTAVVVEVQETRSKGTGKNTIKIKLSDKQAALEKLGRHLGMFKETNKADLAGPDGKPLKAERTVIILPSNGREAS
jgi:phage terminase small subunit